MTDDEIAGLSEEALDTLMRERVERFRKRPRLDRERLQMAWRLEEPTGTLAGQASRSGSREADS